VPHRLLLVDDEPTLRRVLKRSLSRAGFEVVEAANGELAMQLSRDESFDVVITDVRMPDMDGLDLLEQLLTDDPDLPVVLLTGSYEVSSREEAISIGAFDCLRKPTELCEVVRCLARAIEARQLRRKDARRP
jgi:two-component system C4-dicarboxylate transport response regulator DctD